MQGDYPVIQLTQKNQSTFPVIIRTGQGIQRTILVSLGYNLGQLRKLIELETGIAPINQSLLYNGKNL